MSDTSIDRVTRRIFSLKLWRHLRRHLAALLAGAMLLSLAACGGNDEDEVAPQAPEAPAPVSATIGPAGGVIEGPDGTRLEVPPGALDAPVTLTLARRSEGAPPLPEGFPATLPVYELTPHGQVFNVPVRLTLPLAGDPADSAVLVAQPSGEWESVAAELDGRSATLERQTLSWYAPIMGMGLACNGPCPQLALLGVRPPVVTTPSSAVRTVSINNRSTSLVEQRATVTVTFDYSAAADCANGRLRIVRRVAPGTRPSFDRLELDQPVPMAGLPGGRRAGGSVTVTLGITGADNGWIGFTPHFSCRRPNGASGAIYFSLYRVEIPAPPAPVITQQPTAASVVEGSNASFAVSASAANTLVVRWERSGDGGSTWQPVAGATARADGSDLPVPAAALGASGQRYRAVVCNVDRGDESCVLSSVALLTVTALPTVQWQPDSVLAGGRLHSLMVRNNGELWSWGSHSQGQRGRTGGPGAAPVTIGLVRSVAAGGEYSVALLADGSVMAWGDVTRVGGAIGVVNNQFTPLAVNGLTSIRAIATGGNHTLALRDDGTVWGFGPAQLLALGPDIGGRGAVRQIAGIADARQVAAGESHSVVLLADGTVRTWGQNNNGQLGVDTGTGQEGGLPTGTPQTVALTNVIGIAATRSGTYALRADGTVWHWGQRDGTTGNNLRPTQIAGLTGVVRVYAGWRSAFALMPDRSLLGWGANSSGEVGVGIVGTIATPTRLPGLVNVNGVGTGQNHALAATASDAVFGWGANQAQQLNGALGPAESGVPIDTGITR